MPIGYYWLQQIIVIHPIANQKSKIQKTLEIYINLDRDYNHMIHTHIYIHTQEVHMPWREATTMQSG